MNFGRSAREIGEPVLPAETRGDWLPRQVVTLAFLSSRIPASHFADQLARLLTLETAAAVVLVRLKPHMSSDASGPRAALNGEFHMPPELYRTEGGYASLTLAVRSDPPTAAGIDSLLAQLSRHFRHVLVETLVDENPAPWLFELLRRSSLAYLFFKPAADEVYHLDLLLREARTRCPGNGAGIKPIACLGAGDPVDGVDLLAQRVGSPVHGYVRQFPVAGDASESGFQLPETFRADLRRLAREIGGCLVGLALSSGAAKGFAHVGVIQVLEENGIEVDVIAGASMGAYVGSLWAYGCDGRELERLARELEGRWTLWSLIDPAFPPRRGFLRGYAVKKRLMRTIARARFADLARPLRVVATNLATLERVVFSGGEVATAVHASIAVPGICEPITLDGETYVDGGIVDPLPVDILREMGVHKVIAVNVIPTPERIRYGIQAELELARRNGADGHKLFRKDHPVNRQVNYFARGNLLEILMRSVHGAQMRVAEASCRHADLVLRPDIFDDRWLDYRNPGKFIALGRQAAERHLDEIKALVAGKEVLHEQQSASEAMAAVA